ncbi:hypothetical protein WOLCODRAFT_63503 [Wolfiporia cocos MD-104 SS10]|uniref:PB1 domain-containing protein n=1 Tax=Wolfiporia cocos (strain MD-104) TaxID=742152 RepID=A0A2H3IVE1_WOLCO|nr:hypothetical protein WOLCODRAFT_63503 [Wolfiporia cocos MD-104 SS10]
MTTLQSVHIKLTRPPDPLIRKVVFDAPLTWVALAEKIAGLYQITPADVAVSYLDADGDEVTLSSEQELREFHDALPPPPDGAPTVKFSVWDLGAERNKTLPPTPRSSMYRNTFGPGQRIPMVFEVEDEWQRVAPVAPGLGSMLFGHQASSDASGPHAFVEVIESDVESQAQQEDRQTAVSISDSALTDSTSAPSLDKGKGRETVEVASISSDESIVESHEPRKYPIHVIDMSNPNVETLRVLDSRTPTPISRGGSTPRPAAPSAKSRTSTVPAPAQAQAQAPDPDPPLPDLGTMPSASSSTVSLTNDVANLFSTLSTVFASHPELSEGVRTIVRNATNGTYWHAHRDTVARAADEIRRSAVSSSSDISQIAVDARRAAEDAAGRRIAEAIANVVHVIGDVTGTIPPGSSSTPRSQRGRGGSEHRPYPSHHERRNLRRSETLDSWRGGSRGSDDPFVWMNNWLENARVRHENARPDCDADDSAIHSSQHMISEDEKSPPKGKEKKGQNIQTEVADLTQSTTQIISAARGPFPQLEMYGVPLPRSRHTMHGTGTTPRPAVDTSSVAIAAITRRLGDMGFTETAYPSMPKKVRARVPRNAELSPDAEDAAVMDVLEELLQLSPQKPVASGSDTRGEGF